MHSFVPLEGKRGLVIGIANDKSIAYGCAKAFRAAGAELAITYVNEKAEPYVRPLAEQLEAPIILPCDVQEPAQLDTLFATITREWGTLDFVLHSIAYADRASLHGRVTDCSREGFMTAMDVSCYSFIDIAKRSEPLLKNGGSLMTVSYYGSEKVIPHYGVMGPVKAALEGTVRYLAAELGSKRIRVNALSPGAVATRAASGIDRFDALLAESRERSFLPDPLTIEEIGDVAVFLASPASRAITGGVHYVDQGVSVVG